MRKSLLSRSTQSPSLTARKMFHAFYIATLFLCGVANGQPTLVSILPDASKNFIYFNGTVYFSSGDSLFRANTSGPPTLLKTTGGQNISVLYNIVAGSNFFFLTQGASSQTLWRSDGTAANTVAVTTQTQINPLLSYHNQLFMQVRSSTSGSELWKVDLANNATIVKDVNPGASSGFAGSLTIFNDLLYFFGNAGSGQDLWKSDGTAAGTVMAVDLDEGEAYNASGFYGLVVVNGFMFYTRNYEYGEYGDRVADLLKTDGTAAGTSLVTQFGPDYSYNFLSNLLSWKGKLYFFHNESDPIYTYFSVSDGTAAGTHHIDRTTIDGGGRQLIDAGDYILLYGESQSFTTPIEKYDGSTVTVVHEFSMYHSAGDQYIDLTYTDGRAFFLDDVGAYWGGSSELWQADLASGTTRAVQDIYGFSLAGSANITKAGSSIFFTRRTGGETSLWYYDPNKTSTGCAGAGAIQREKWANITGYSISSIPVYTQDPTSITTLTSFSTPQNDGDNYGARVRGYVCVPESGNYVFWISSDDNSELWLSTDDNPANKRLIASSKWTKYNEWTKYTTQQSAEIALVKGQKYYIEALHKEATGADHLSVGWKLPSGTLERPIPGNRLIPFDRGEPPYLSISQPWDGQQFTAPANININAYANDNDGTITKVSFYANGQPLTVDSSEPYSFTWQNVPAGNYTIEARATDNDNNTRSTSVNITVAAASCAGTGGLYQEFWWNVTGSDVRAFDFSQPYNGGTRYLTSFETTQYFGNNYASRMRGQICVPQTGNYTFWISSDDQSELYLSTDDGETNKKLIAWVYGYTQFRNYDKYPTQKSALIHLEAGRKYYIEARHKESTGNDFISVGWQLPDGTMERPIGGNRLISLAPPPNNPPSITITSPQPDQNFTSSSVRISADVTDPDGVKEVRFVVSYGTSSSELARFTAPPYEFTWNNPPSGSYQLLVSATDMRNSGTSKSLYFSVDKSECSGTGKLYREIWTGISGTSISSIPVNTTPNATMELSSFATPNYYGNDYGSRIRGYVCPPVSGVYVFMISSDDSGELWISTNDDPANKHKIAYVTGATRVNEWDKYGTQISGGVNLVQGQRYYVEVLHKEANGADHVEVGWQLPSGTLERPITGDHVIPFEDLSTSAAAFATDGLYDIEEESELSVYPNPVSSNSEVTLELPGSEAGALRVEIFSATGRSMQSEEIMSSGEEVTIGLKPAIIPGMYLIQVVNDRKRWAKKIQVK